MRSSVVSAALVLVIAGGSSCRPYKGAPVGVAAPGEAAVPPSGVDTRAVYRLPNGVRVVLEENHAAPVVAFQAWIHAGGVDDPPGQEGVAHLFQHLLLTSGRARPPAPPATSGETLQGAALSAAAAAAPAAVAAGEGTALANLASSGARLSSWTTHEDTVFAAVVASPFVDDGVRALAALLRQHAFGGADFEAARRAAQDDLRQAAAVPARVAAQVALATAYPSHPYGRPLLGTDSSLAALRPEQVKSFFDRFYVPGNVTLVVVGDFDGAACRALVASAFGDWAPGGPAPPPARAAPPADSDVAQVAVFSADIPAPQLVVAFRIAAVKAADVPALELLAALLGPRRGGRLEMEIVRNRQLATAPHAYLFKARDGGLLITTATLGPGRPEEAARATRDEILRLGHDDIGAEELDRARTQIEGDGAADKASLAGYARKLGLSMSVAADPNFEAAYLERLNKVDAADVKRVAARTLTTANMVIAVVLPAARDSQREDRAAKLLPRLRAVAASPLVASASPAATGAVPTTSGRDVAEYLLPVGVRLLVLRDDTAPQLSVRAVWSGGVRLQEARLAGAASLLARLLPRATKTRGADVLANELADAAGTIDGVAATDSLALRGDFLASHWERGLELLIDCARNPKLGDDDIERERRVLLDAIRSRDDDPGELALALFRGALFGRHPYHQHLLGTADAVAGLNRRRLLDHFRQYYGARGLTLAVVGPVEANRIAAKVQSLFADAPPAAPGGGRESAPLIAPPPRTEPSEVFQLIAKDQARLVIGYPGLALRDPDRFALEVLAEVLGGTGGRMVAPALRAQGILAEQTGAVSQEGVEPGYFAIYAAASPPAIDGLVPVLRAELRRLVEGGVTDAEVFRARRVLVGTHALALERRGAVAMALALHGAFGGAGRSYRREVDELAKVTAADVSRVARRLIDPRREVLAVVRPRDGARAERTVTQAGNLVGAAITAGRPLPYPALPYAVLPSGAAALLPPPVAIYTSR